MLVVAIPTLFLARRFYSEVIGRWIGAPFFGSGVLTTLRTIPSRYRTARLSTFRTTHRRWM